LQVVVAAHSLVSFFFLHSDEFFLYKVAGREGFFNKLLVRQPSISPYTVKPCTQRSLGSGATPTFAALSWRRTPCFSDTAYRSRSQSFARSTTMSFRSLNCPCSVASFSGTRTSGSTPPFPVWSLST